MAMTYLETDRLQLCDAKRTSSAYFTRHTRCSTQETLNHAGGTTAPGEVLLQTYDIPSQTERPDVRLLIEKFEAFHGPCATKGGCLRKRLDGGTTFGASVDFDSPRAKSPHGAVSTLPNDDSSTVLDEMERNERIAEDVVDCFDIVEGNPKLRSVSRFRPATISEEFEQPVIHVPTTSFRTQFELLEESNLCDNDVSSRRAAGGSLMRKGGEEGGAKPKRTPWKLFRSSTFTRTKSIN